VPGHPGPGHNAGDYDHHAERQARIQRQNEEHQRQRDADLQRHRLEQMIMSETLHATGNGQDLRPALTEGGENYAKLNTRKALPSVEANRNYMAGVGLFLRRVSTRMDMRITTLSCTMTRLVLSQGSLARMALTARSGRTSRRA